MNKRNIAKCSVYLTRFFIGTSLLILSFVATAQAHQISREEAKMTEIWELLREKFFKPLPINPAEKFSCLQKMLAGGLKECLDDSYAAYIISEQAQTNSRQFGGIGIQTIFNEKKQAIIAKVTDGTSAGRSKKLERGDIIVEIDGESARNKTHRWIAKKVRGKVGSSVLLRVERAGILQEPITLVREFVQLPPPVSVSGVEIESGVVYLRIKSFDDEARRQFFAAINKYRAIDPDTRFIISLRDNLGGDLYSMTAIVQCFSKNPDEKVIAVKSFRKNQELFLRDIGIDFAQMGACVDLNGVLLANEETASAAEAFAVLLHQWIGMPIVGTRTLGKGMITPTFALSDGDSIVFSTYEFLVGTMETRVEGFGVSPDYEETGQSAMDALLDVNDAPDANDIREAIRGDVQLRRALNLIKGHSTKEDKS